MQRVLASIAVLAGALALAACATTGAAQPTLKHHWVLTSIDGNVVDAGIHSGLHIRDNLQISGQAGCNRFFGHATLKNHVFNVDHLGVTLMACRPKAQKVEKIVLGTLGGGAAVKLSDHTLKLVGNQHTLLYRQADNNP